MSKYSKLPNTSLHANDLEESDDSQISNPLFFSSNSQSQQNLFKLKILYKETSFEITTLSENSLISELKAAIEQVSEVPQVSQRLIFSGKLLKPEDKSLSFFKITNQSNIHLFPIPAAVATPVSTPHSSTTITASNRTGSTPVAHATSFSIFDLGSEEPDAIGVSSHAPTHFDPDIARLSKEVRLWSLLLIFLSSITIFNNFSFFSSTGRIGDGVLDSIVTLFDIGCSVAGVVVGRRGLLSAASHHTPTVRNYVRSLTLLFLFCMCLRGLWVVDVVMEVRKAIQANNKLADLEKEQAQAGGDETDSNLDSGSSTPPVHHQHIPEKAVSSFGVQAMLIFMLCLYAWASCLLRACRLRFALERHEEREARTREERSPVIPV